MKECPQIVRQRGLCLGCRCPLKTPCQSPGNHTRGHLCGDCDLSLRTAYYDPAILRRLTAFLTYDATERYVYVTGSLQNPRVPEVGNAIRAEGYNVRDDWYGAGPEADICWMNYSKARGQNYIEALEGISAQNTYLFDRVYIDHADAVVLVSPGGKSSFLELGYFLGTGKPGFILVEDEPAKYDVMPNFATAVVSTLNDLLFELDQAIR